MTYSMTIICEKHFYKEIHLLTIFAIFRALKSAQNNRKNDFFGFLVEISAQNIPCRINS